MELKQLCSIIESILFVRGEEVHYDEVVKIIREGNPEVDITKKMVSEAVVLLQERYKDKMSGLTLLCTKETLQLATVPENHGFMEVITVQKRKKSLTQSAMETLSIIAYQQPVTKLEIEEVRGVKCDSTIRVLLDYGLIREAGRLDRIGKPILYRTTQTFLVQFNLKDISELPNFEQFIVDEKELSLFDEEQASSYHHTETQ